MKQITILCVALLMTGCGTQAKEETSTTTKSRIDPKERERLIQLSEPLLAYARKQSPSDSFRGQSFEDGAELLLMAEASEELQKLYDESLKRKDFYWWEHLSCYTFKSFINRTGGERKAILKDWAMELLTEADRPVHEKAYVPEQFFRALKLLRAIDDNEELRRRYRVALETGDTKYVKLLHHHR